VSEITPTPNTAVRREERASYDRADVYSILDEALYCSIAFEDGGRPVVIPTLHARIGNSLYLHGSPATRLFRVLKQGPQVCVSVTLMDGLVLARSAFNHSANYRSVVLFGVTEPITNLVERRQVLDAFTDKLVPGRRPHLRPMTDKEVRATAVMRLPIEEAAAKIRRGPPLDDDPDYELPIWAGVIPIITSYGAPVPDPIQHPDATEPAHLGFFRQ
jgi:nitroimidazol reductase NimA-like FMN-containing flavoprotein (pyridoxamine 5'-phosphate oxidase superfamily)